MNILTNKSYKTYERVSRYNDFPYYYNTVDKKYMYGTTTNLNDTTSYSVYEVLRGDTLDSLALEFYNNPTLYWIIADFNRIRDPYAPLKVGSHIKIPVFSSITFNK